MRNAITWRTAIGLAAGLCGVALLLSRTGSAATSVMIVMQYGIGYLPVMVAGRLGLSSPTPSQPIWILALPRPA